MKTSWYWHKKQPVDKWNQIEDLDIIPHIYSHLIHDKEAKIIQWGKAFSKNRDCII